MKHRRQTAKVALMTLLLSVATLASPRVALIKVNSGSADLDGKAFKHAQMATAGQLLSVPKGAEVRIQLLGSSSELTVSGPVQLKIDQATLAGKAQKVTRGGLEVASDIGSRNTVGALVTRAKADHLDQARPRAVRPILPPAKRNGSLVVEYDLKSQIKLPQGAEVNVLIEPKNPADDQYVQMEFKDSLGVLEIAPDAVVAGEGYNFTLAYTYNDSVLQRYTQSFRILTPEQREFLQDANVEMLERYDAEKSVLPLLRLASLYQDLDQNREVLKYLELAERSPYLQENDSKLKARLSDLLSQFRKSMDMTILILD